MKSTEIITNVANPLDIQEMKNKLILYRKLNRKIDNNIERLERLESKMYSASSSNLSGMPKSGGSPIDKFCIYAERHCELETKIKDEIKARDFLKKYFEGLLEKLKNPDEIAIIEMRYLDCEEWFDIIDMLFGSKKDFDDSYDNYKQRAFRLHNNAISNMALVNHQ